MIFTGTPNMLVKLRVPIGRIKSFRFNEEGHFSTDNSKLIKRIANKFTELTKIDDFPCKKCEFTTDNKGKLMVHYRDFHIKEG